MFLLVSALGVYVCACVGGRGVFKICMHLILFFLVLLQPCKTQGFVADGSEEKKNWVLTGLQSASGFPGQ